MSFRRPVLVLDYSYRAVDLGSGIAAIEAPGSHNGTAGRSPDGGTGQFDPGTFVGATRPPIGRARLAMAPDNDVVVAPIKVVVEP